MTETVDSRWSKKDNSKPPIKAPKGRPNIALGVSPRLGMPVSSSAEGAAPPLSPLRGLADREPAVLGLTPQATSSRAFGAKEE